MAVSGSGHGKTPQSLATPAFAGFSPVAENGTKAALTTGMTTDRKNFIFTPRRGIMAEIEYPGVVQLIERVVWDHEAASLSLATRTKNLQHNEVLEVFLHYFPTPKSVIISDGITFSNFDFNRDPFWRSNKMLYP